MTTLTEPDTTARYRTLFRIDFHAEMTDAALARLAGRLGMATHTHPKLYASPVPPAVGRLDFFSGLFLTQEGENAWRLEARSWARPPQPVDSAVRRWHLSALGAVHELDHSISEVLV
jgi:hypothetical protein